jgi:hypothetical protein
MNLTTKPMWKLPKSTQLRAIWYTNLPYMVVLQFTAASRYHNCYIDGGSSPEYFENTLLHIIYNYVLLYI